ncbi:phospho-sugar mutase [Spiribacter insolitus]|uniref:Phospho-sugar mutase n=1 Tax=Spiribacter insolitus TaxID=3122417 RepID=A0ABV3T8M4_9GAMM
MDGDDLKQLLEYARAWRDADPDPETRRDLDQRIQRAEAALSGEAGAETDTGHIESDPPITALRNCFDPALGFGTAGLRGLKGPGPAHINHRLIQRVTAVMADVLRAEVPDAAERGVVIGYDARHGSTELADTAARTIAGAGLGVHVLDDYAPTPLVAFAALELQAAAGIVLTASHNPPEYLGYKVYWSNAAQLVSPIDQRIAQALKALPAGVEIPKIDAAEAAQSEICPYWKIYGESLRTRYLEAIRQPGSSSSGAWPAVPSDPATAVIRPTASGVSPSADNLSKVRPTLRIAYSAMHGVAGELVRAALAEQGGIDLYEVTEQAAPDGGFPTVRFPNPEEPGALDRLTELAAEVGADVALATDPDGDRLAVALPDEHGDWRVLMGDQTGVLMGDYLMARQMAATGKDKPGGGQSFVMNTVVSSRLLGRLAAHYGIDFEQTLTGFKWIWYRALQREATGDRFLYAYEDAIGFCPTRRVRDKDGIAAAVVMAELARDALAAGTTLNARLQALYQRHGLSVNRQVNIKLTGDGARERMKESLQALRADPPGQIAGLQVTRIHDYQAAESHRPDGSDPEPIPLPTTDLVQLDLTGVDSAESGAAAGAYHASIRPSGTEPKLKIYLEYLGRPDSPDSAAEAAEAEEGLGRLGEALRERLA